MERASVPYGLGKVLMSALPVSATMECASVPYDLGKVCEGVDVTPMSPIPVPAAMERACPL